MDGGDREQPKPVQRREPARRECELGRRYELLPETHGEGARGGAYPGGDGISPAHGGAVGVCVPGGDKGRLRGGSERDGMESLEQWKSDARRKDEAPECLGSLRYAWQCL